LKGRPAFTERPGSLAEPVDFDKVKAELAEKIGFEPKFEEVLSYLMYPQVFLDYQAAYQNYGDVTLLDTPTFFSGLRLNETVAVQIEKGKTLIIRLDEIGEPDIEGNRVLFFNLNGQRREVVIKDTSIKSALQIKRKAEPTNKAQIGATMSGSVLQILVKKGEKVEKGDALLVTEAMKMETSIEARYDGIVDHIYVVEGESISSGDLLIEVKEN
jgi:pyruvate carboxylase